MNTGRRVRSIGTKVFKIQTNFFSVKFSQIFPQFWVWPPTFSVLRVILAQFGQKVHFWPKSKFDRFCPILIKFGIFDPCSRGLPRFRPCGRVCLRFGESGQIWPKRLQCHCFTRPLLTFYICLPRGRRCGKTSQCNAWCGRQRRGARAPVPRRGPSAPSWTLLPPPPARHRRCPHPRGLNDDAPTHGIEPRANNTSCFGKSART